MQTPDDKIPLEWVRSLRKAELHLHLLGAIRPHTAFDLARKYRVDFPVKQIEDWKPFFASGNLADFVESFIRLFELAREREDFDRVAREVFEDLAADGVYYAEPRVTVTSHLARGVDREEMIGGLTDAADYAQRELGLAIGWIIDFPRILGPKVADRALAEAISGREWGVVGFDVAGYESTTGKDLHFEGLFHNARESGLGITVHAGEIGPAENVRYAVEKLKADRIGHGIRSIDDPSLVRILVEKKTPLEVCPTSNLCLKGIDKLENHPLEELRRAGVPITLNTDDPSLFGVSLSEEIQKVALAFRWSRETVLDTIENAWRRRFRTELPIPVGHR
jgi:adenosine deaminase